MTHNSTSQNLLQRRGDIEGDMQVTARSSTTGNRQNIAAIHQPLRDESHHRERSIALTGVVRDEESGANTAQASCLRKCLGWNLMPKAAGDLLPGHNSERLKKSSQAGENILKLTFRDGQLSSAN